MKNISWFPTYYKVLETVIRMENSIYNDGKGKSIQIQRLQLIWILHVFTNNKSDRWYLLLITSQVLRETSIGMGLSISPITYHSIKSAFLPETLAFRRLNTTWILGSNQSSYLDRPILRRYQSRHAIDANITRINNRRVALVYTVGLAVAGACGVSAVSPSLSGYACCQLAGTRETHPWKIAIIVKRNWYVIKNIK